MRPRASAARCVELVEARDDEHLRLDAPGRRADAVAEAEHRDRRGVGRGDLQAFLAPDPARHHHGLGADVLEAVLLHLADRPLDRVFERPRTAQPVPVGVGQLREPLPRGGIRERGADEARGRVTVGIEPRGRGLRRCRRRAACARRPLRQRRGTGGGWGSWRRGPAGARGPRRARRGAATTLRGVQYAALPDHARRRRK